MELLDWLSSKNIQINKKKLQQILVDEDKTQADSIADPYKKVVNSRGKFWNFWIYFL